MWGLLSWTYWLGPVAGGVVASLLYRFVLEGPDEASGGLIRGESAGFQEHQNRIEIQPHAAVHSVETIVRMALCVICSTRLKNSDTEGVRHREGRR